MTAISEALVERRIAPERPAREMTPGGLVLSALLHVGVVAAILVGLPNLFRRPPPEETPIAVELVMIAPKTTATHPNPYRPKPEAKPEPPVAAPAPKPEPKPEPPQPAPEPPAAAPAAAQPPPPAPAPPKPEVNTPPPPPPPKPVEAKAPPPPPPAPKPEPRQAHHATPKPEVKKTDAAAFNKLINDLEHKKPEPAQFDALMKNLTHDQVAQAEDAPPAPHRTAATAPPSSQPKAPLGSQLTASQIDLIREQLRPCFNPPFGAKEKPDLVADIRVVMNRDGTVQQAKIVDQGQYAGDPIYRAIADSGVRALRNPQCSPLRFPPEDFAAWQTFVFGFSTRDMQ